MACLGLAAAALTGLAWPVQAETATPAGQVTPPAGTLPPPATQVLSPDRVGITLYLPPDPPTASIQVKCGLPGDDGWCRMPVKVLLMGNAAGSPIARLDDAIDGQPQSQAQDTYLYEDGINGNHSVSLSALDRLGRRSETVSQSYKVDRSLPTSSFNGVADGGLAVSISDEGSGVARWTVQIFDGSGRSVFYREGTGAFDGSLAWDAPSGVYQIEVFVRDSAGNETHFPRTDFAMATPTPPSIVQQVFGFFAPSPTAAPRTSTPTPGSAASTTAAPSTAVTPTTTPQPSPAVATPITAASQPAIAVAPTEKPTAATAAPSHFLGWLSLAAVETAALVWALAASLNRRAPALTAVAEELERLLRLHISKRARQP